MKSNITTLTTKFNFDTGIRTVTITAERHFVDNKPIEGNSVSVDHTSAIDESLPTYNKDTYQKFVDHFYSMELK